MYRASQVEVEVTRPSTECWLNAGTVFVLTGTGDGTVKPHVINSQEENPLIYACSRGSSSADPGLSDNVRETQELV